MNMIKTPTLGSITIYLKNLFILY